MKQLLVIILCFCIFVPETARIIAGNFCAYTIIDEDANPVCACTFNSVPIESQQSSFPDSHKQILQQTDWQYLSSTFNEYDFAIASVIKSKYPQLSILYTSRFFNSVFHPPSFS